MVERYGEEAGSNSSRGSGPAVIKVIGVGGGGCNTVRRMMRARQIPGVEYVVANTDVKSLDLVQGALTLRIGEHFTQGFGARGDIKVGRQAAEESKFLLRRVVKDSDIVLLTAGMGGGTGTGAAPVVARIARESGALVVAIVTTPFLFEGRNRRDVALAGIELLREQADNVIVVDNDRLPIPSDENANVAQAFSMIDDTVSQAILSVAALVNVPGEINVDLADVKSILVLRGTASLALGQGEGRHAAMDAAEQAVSNLPSNVTLASARGMLASFAAGPDSSLFEINEAAASIAGKADPYCRFKFGLIRPAEQLRGRSKVTLIVTGSMETRPQA